MRRMLALFAVALAGGLIATLAVVALPASGSSGDPLILSQVNQAGPLTVLKSNGGFRIVAKNPKRPPLAVWTTNGTPPLQVNSNAKVANLNADLIDGLDSAAFLQRGDVVQSVAAFAGGDQERAVTSAPSVVREVSLLPPADGTVIVNSTVAAAENTAHVQVLCSITTGNVLDFGYLQGWESAGSAGMFGQLAGTRGFPVFAGVPFTANLVCRNVGGTGEVSTLADSALTAIFVPAHEEGIILSVGDGDSGS